MLRRLSATALLIAGLLIGSAGIAHAETVASSTGSAAVASICDGTDFHCSKSAQMQNDIPRKHVKKHHVHKRRLEAQPQSLPFNLAAFQACVIRAESSGNPQVMNASGHYGLYQFSKTLWTENGGNPKDFGHGASVAEQNQVFINTMNNPSSGGAMNWAPYDGC